jgi:hypothetical protein
MEPLRSRDGIETKHFRIFSRRMFHSLMAMARPKYQSTLFTFITSILIVHSMCKSIIRKLLIKDELKRLGSRAGASDIKVHAFFRTTQWALLRNSKPPIIPHQGRSGIDTVNFRNVKESHSVDLGAGPHVSNGHMKPPKGVPLDSGLRTPNEEEKDPFEEFNSVTLHHDGEDEGIIVGEEHWEVGTAK